MTGKLLLNGIRPADTPLDEWCAAVFAVLVDSASGVDADKLEEFGAKLEEPLPGEERDDLDWETWGTSEKAQDAQRRLFDSFGVAGQAE